MKSHVPPSIVFQGEIAECGLACICMLAEAVGRPIELAELRERFPVPSSGASLDDLMLILDALGIRAVAVRFDSSDLPDLPVPCILHYDGNHFVLASNRKGAQIRILNPATGDAVFSAKALSLRTSGFAIILAQELQGAPVTPPPGRAEQPAAISLLRFHIPRFWRLLGITLLLGAIGLIGPIVFAGFVDYRMEHDTSSILGIFIAICMAAGISYVMELYAARLQIAAVNTMGRSHIPMMFAGLMKKKFVFYEKRSLADICQKFFSFDGATLQRLGISINRKSSLIVGSLAVAAMFFINPWLAATVLTAIAVLGGVTLHFSARHGFLIRRLQELTGEKNDFVFESIRGIGTIKSAGLIVDRASRFAVKYGDALIVSAQLRSLEARRGALYKLVANIEVAVTFTFSIYFISMDLLSFGYFFVFMFFKQLAMSSASDFYMARLGEAEHTIIDQRAQDILRYPEDTRPARSNALTHQLSAKAVRFAYEGAEASHVEIDLNIACGEKIALIGESGSGKSTVLKLLSGARTPQAGEISVDGEACSSSDLEAIAFLSRPDDILFHASLNDNLTLFGTSDTCIDARKVALRLGLDGLVERLPQGWETTVSEIAPMMSAGQRQRLMVARALCSRKPLILLDEPTANLDEHACKVTLTAILSSPKTIIVALHDYSLLNAFDRVFRIEGGHPLELSTKQIHEIYS